MYATCTSLVLHEQNLVHWGAAQSGERQGEGVAENARVPHGHPREVGDMFTRQAWALGLMLLVVGALLGSGCASVADSGRGESHSLVEPVPPRREVAAGSAFHFEQSWLAHAPTGMEDRTEVPMGARASLIPVANTSSQIAMSQVPLTTLRLRAVASAQGIGAGLTGIAFNRAVGLAFEHWILYSLAIPRNTRSFLSPVRAAATGGLPASVIPEAVRPIVWVKWGVVPTAFPDSLFCEVKAVRGVMTLSHSRHQLRGLIDVAARSPVALASSPHKPIVAFITTGDTAIGTDVVAEATRRGVAIWRAFVLEDLAATNPSLSIGPFTPLNPSVYPPGALVLPRLKLHLPGALTSPAIPPVVVPADPDPTEVGP